MKMNFNNLEIRNFNELKHDLAMIHKSFYEDIPTSFLLSWALDIINNCQYTETERIFRSDEYVDYKTICCVCLSEYNTYSGNEEEIKICYIERDFFNDEIDDLNACSMLSIFYEPCS